MLYEITTDDGKGFATYKARKRSDAAKFQIQQTVYEVAGAYGLRDLECAWNALARLTEAVTFAAIGAHRSFKIGDTTICVFADPRAI